MNARYEVTMNDGWKIRVNADTEADAVRKAESSSTAKGSKAITAKVVDERESLKTA